MGAATPPNTGQFHTRLPSVYPPVTGLSQPLFLTVFCGSVFLILNKTKSWQLVRDCVCAVGVWSLSNEHREYSVYSFAARAAVQWPGRDTGTVLGQERNPFTGHRQCLVLNADSPKSARHFPSPLPALTPAFSEHSVCLLRSVWLLVRCLQQKVIWNLDSSLTSFCKYYFARCSLWEFW